MKMTVTESMFHDMFKLMNRQDNFSYEGLSALYEYLEDNYPDYDLNVIELCALYSEYDSVKDAADYYGYDNGDEMDDDECESDMIDWLNDHHFCIPLENGGIIVQD